MGQTLSSQAFYSLLLFLEKSLDVFSALLLRHSGAPEVFHSMVPDCFLSSYLVLLSSCSQEGLLLLPALVLHSQTPLFIFFEKVGYLKSLPLHGFQVVMALHSVKFGV
jgi:hypothetical protein